MVLSFSLVDGVKVTFTHGDVQLTVPLTALPEASVRPSVADLTISLKVALTVEVVGTFCAPDSGESEAT